MNDSTSSSAAAGPSRTTTITNPPSPAPQNDVGILRLRPSPPTSSTAPRRVVWTDETVDNEGLGRKKSKICCIYHKPKPFDESSDESSSGSDSDGSDSATSESGEESDSDDAADRPNVSRALEERLRQQSEHRHDAHEQCKGRHGGKRKVKGGKQGIRSSGGTQTITEELAEEGAQGGREDSDDDDAGRDGFKPNAYERGPR